MEKDLKKKSHLFRKVSFFFLSHTVRQMGARCIVDCYLNQIAVAVVDFSSSELVEGVLELNVLCK